jgi:hypothetical protein
MRTDRGARIQPYRIAKSGQLLRKGIRAGVFTICAVAAFLVVSEISSCAQSVGPFPNDPDLPGAIAIQGANQQSLFSVPGVNGVGIARVNGALVLQVLVNNTNHISEIPTSLDGLAVTVQNVGTIHASVCGGSNPQAAYPLPVPLGVSGGNILQNNGECASGTIGFKVRDNVGGVIGWIGNNHVVGNGTNFCPGSAPIGTPEYQPGPIDLNCGQGQLVGTLNRFIPIDFGGGNNEVDAGYVQSSDAAISPIILNLGLQVNNVVPAFVGEGVRKNGRTTACTEGTVTAVNMTINVTYDGATCVLATFTNQIEVSPISFSSPFAAPGDSGSPIVDLNNNAVGLLFAGDPTTGIAFGNPIGAVLSALNVSLAGNTSSQVVTRTSRYWFTHGFSSDTNCATLLAAIQANGGAIDLGFVTLPTANRNADNVIDSNDTFIEALSFYWRSVGRTGEPGGNQSEKLHGSPLCTARKQMAVELIAATANAALLDTFPGNATYNNGGTITNFPPDLISQAQTVAAGFDVVAIKAMTALLKKFNSSGLTNNLPNGLLECSPQPSKILKPIALDPTLQNTCPGLNNSCAAAAVVAFPNSSNPFAHAVFKQSVDLTTFTANMPAPSCNSGGRDAVWQVPPTIGTVGRQFSASSDGSNFNTMLAVFEGVCGDLTEVTCSDAFAGIEGESVTFNTDGTNTFYIVAEGAAGQYGKLKLKITSP